MTDPSRKADPPADGRAPRRSRRRALHWPTILWLTIVWCLLWGEFSVGNIVAGVVVSGLILLVFPLLPLELNGRPHFWPLLKLIGRFLFDVVASSVEVAAIALRFGTQPHNAVIVVPLRTRNEFVLFVTAEMVSLVPGSLLIEASRSTWSLQVHVIDRGTRQQVEQARQRVWDQERRVVEAIGTQDEIAEFRRASSTRRAGS